MIKVVVGLGNPGAKYVLTPHNAGFMCLDRWFEGPWSEDEVNITSSLSLEGQSLALVKPQTFMNLSGKGVSLAMKKHNCLLSEVLVIYDDADVPIGRIRASLGGGARGHNGLRSIMGTVGQGFWRIGVGVGRDDRMDLGSYVLKSMARDSIENLIDVFDRLWDHRGLFFQGCEAKLSQGVRSVNGT